MDSKYLFVRDQEMRKKLGQVLESWVGTRYHHHAGIKGTGKGDGGVDCLHLVVRVAEETGIVPTGVTKLPPYPENWHFHKQKEWLLTELRKHGNLEEVDPYDRFDGDILALKYGRVDSHLAWYFDGHIYHSVTKLGVQKNQITDRSFCKNLRHSFRIVK